jgi:hypothetical protein
LPSVSLGWPQRLSLIQDGPDEKLSGPFSIVDLIDVVARSFLLMIEDSSQNRRGHESLNILFHYVHNLLSVLDPASRFSALGKAENIAAASTETRKLRR